MTHEEILTTLGNYVDYLIAGSSARLWYLFQFGHHPPQQAVHGG